MLPNYQARSPFVLKHTTSVICIYVCMDGTMPFNPFVPGPVNSDTDNGSQEDDRG